MKLLKLVKQHKTERKSKLQSGLIIIKWKTLLKKYAILTSSY